MKLDTTTILFLLLVIAGVIGVIFLGAWLKQRSEIYLRAGLTGLLVALGTTLILARGAIPDRLSIDAANALLLIGVGFGWSAIRRFEGQPAPPWLMLAGAVVWLAACAFPAFHASLGQRMALISAIAAAYSFAAAYEFLRGRRDTLTARRALAVVCVCQGFIAIGRGAYMLVIAPSANPFQAGPIQALLLAEPVVLIVVVAVLGVALVREAAETSLRRSAGTDALTGVLNRGAFFAGAEEMVRIARRDRLAMALLLFDLDHFKTINDRYGHLMGDLALGAFTRAVSNVVRAADLVGRIGGEEFAVLISGVDAATAIAIAERIRFDFSRTSVAHDGKALTATVSAGIAVASGDSVDLQAMVAEADRALYEAKRSGRDRVHSALALAG
jgi:diguanylate cyclase (GGDEF)-like protein